jgi:hypothetical protein
MKKVSPEQAALVRLSVLAVQPAGAFGLVKSRLPWRPSRSVLPRHVQGMRMRRLAFTAAPLAHLRACLERLVAAVAGAGGAAPPAGSSQPKVRGLRLPDTHPAGHAGHCLP